MDRLLKELALRAELADLVAAKGTLEKNSIPVPHNLETAIWAFQEEITKRSKQEFS
jgi:hypothetical protein